MNEPISGVKEASSTTRRTPVSGKLLSIVIILVAVALGVWVWRINHLWPRTADAAVRANVVDIVPRVNGPIIKLPLQDNQAVKMGELLFEIDPTDYELSVERAKSSLAGLDQQIATAKTKASQAESTLKRLVPLLPKGFATAEKVEQAETEKNVALSTTESLIAQRAGAVAQLKTAETELSYCRVTAPFDGRVVSLNISEGAYATAGHPVFSFLDTRHWYVMADFREGHLPRILPGVEAEFYLLAAPHRRFRGRVHSVGWAVQPESGGDSKGVPSVQKEINWVHVAQRFPVRIEVENPDPDLFRMGASAVVTIRGRR
jgi:multidrug efflux system membrane fusion protein